MSAYVCEDDTINRVVGYLATTDRSETKALAELGYDLGNRRDLTRLAKDMLNLNVRSVKECYGERTKELFPSIDSMKQKYRSVHTTEMQFFKSLQCYTYQSCQGNCDKEPLYLALDGIEKAFATKIAAKYGYHGPESYRDCVSKLPEYKKATWG